MLTCFVLALALILAAPAQGSAGGDWHYSVPERGAPRREPIATRVPLSEELPEDAECEVELAAGALFGQLRYGDPDSIRVLVALARDLGGAPALWVDADRDRKLEADERAEGAGERFEVALAVSHAGGLEPRRVLLRADSSGAALSCATLGWLEGEVELDGERAAARRVDGDADGFVTGPRDQLWLDLDGDGDFAALAELYLYAPTLRIGAARYAPRSDLLGRTLALERLEGTGRIELSIAPLLESRVLAANVLLVGRDGSAVGVRELRAPIEVPSGEYRLGMVTLWLADPAGGEGWGYVFSDSGARAGAHWHSVERDETIDIDVVGELSFRSHAGVAPGGVAPGERISCAPRLYTGDGLLINAAYRGGPDAGSAREADGAVLRLLTPADALLDSGTSGFA